MVTMLMTSQEHLPAGESDCGGMNWLIVVSRLDTTPMPPRHSYLVVKQEHKESARETFADTDVHITTHGKWKLGAPLGSKTFNEEYVNDKVQGWTKNHEFS